MALPIELVVGVVVWRLSLTPGWTRFRSFTWVALTAACFSVASLPFSFDVVDDRTMLWASRAAQAAAGWHLAAWLLNASASATADWQRRARAVARAVLVTSFVPWVPGLTVAEPVWSVTTPGWALTQHVTTTPPVGVAYAVLVPLVLALVFAVYLRRWRAGDLDARAYVIGLSFFFASLGPVAAGPLGFATLPLLGDLGFIAVMLAVLANILRQLSADATRLRAMTAQLEAQVEDRSRELEQAWGILARTERLAALGELSARVAHDVNNPLAWVTSNLRFLSGQCKDNEDAAEALADAEQGAQRIAQAVAQLGQYTEAAGRAPPEPLIFTVLLKSACEIVKAQERPTLAVQLDGSIGTRVGDRAQVQRLLVQVLLALTRPGADVDADQPVVTRLDEDGDSVRLTMRGPAPAPAIEVAATEPLAELTVARAIARSLRGSLEVSDGAVVIRLPLSGTVGESDGEAN